jgi:Zn finger protein HypA/HybF involved in hydrogenase expression
VIAAGLVVVAVVVVVVSVLLHRHREAEVMKPLVRPFWCEQCQAEFMAGARDIRAVCPKCNTESTVIRHYHICANCGERFLAYDLEMVSGMARLPGQDEEVYFQHLPRSFQCPKCGATDSTLEKYERR